MPRPKKSTQERLPHQFTYSELGWLPGNSAQAHLLARKHSAYDQEMRRQMKVYETQIHEARQGLSHIDRERYHDGGGPGGGMSRRNSGYPLSPPFPPVRNFDYRHCFVIFRLIRD